MPLPPSLLTFHNVNNHGGGSAEGELGGIARNEERKKTKKTTHRGKPRQTEIKTTKKDIGGGTINIESVFFLVKTSQAEGWRRFHKNTAHARSGVQVFWCSGFKVNDTLESQKVTREGGPKMAKIQKGVKRTNLRGRPKNGQIFGWVKKSTFWASSSAQKVLLTAEKKWGRPKIDENFGWGKTRTSLRGRPKKGQNSIWGKTGHL